MPNAEIERRMILKNQHTIMTALLALVGPDRGKLCGALFYDIAKTRAYLGDDGSDVG